MRQIDIGVKLYCSYMLQQQSVTIQGNRIQQYIKVPRFRRIDIQTTRTQVHIQYRQPPSPFSLFFRNDLQHLVLGRDGASFVPGLASPIPCPLLLSFREIHGYTIQYFKQTIINFKLIWNLVTIYNYLLMDLYKLQKISIHQIQILFL